jgi:hypothetical protein
VGIIKSFSQGVTNRVHAATGLDTVKKAFTRDPPRIPRHWGSPAGVPGD